MLSGFKILDFNVNAEGDNSIFTLKKKNTTKGQTRPNATTNELLNTVIIVNNPTEMWLSLVL